MLCLLFDICLLQIKVEIYDAFLIYMYLCQHKTFAQKFNKQDNNFFIIMILNRNICQTKPQNVVT